MKNKSTIDIPFFKNWKELFLFLSFIILFTNNVKAQSALYQEGFEGTHGWTFVNGSQTNKWVVGTATSWSGSRSLYISNNSGTSNTYTGNAASVVQAYKDVAIPAGTTTASLQFYFKCNGQAGQDYFRVWLVPSTFTPNAGTQITAGGGRVQIGANFRNGDANWYITSYNNLDISAFAGGNMRLVFEWRNNNATANQPPAAIDNIIVHPYCIPFTNGDSFSYGDYINSFITTGGITNISNTGSGYTETPQGYGDFYDTHSVSQVPSGTINFSATPGSNTYVHGLRVWVDWNKNGIFDSSEIVYTTPATATGTLTGAFVVPAGQAAGDYRMRVILRYNATTGIAACDASYDGEVEDYKLTVLPAASCDPISATAAKYVICPGETTTLSANSTTSGYTYTWYTDWDNDTHTGTLVGTGASINVNPTESTLYGVVATKSGCPTGVNAEYQLISISVTPPPTLIVLDPVDAIACSEEYREINVVSGGNIPNERSEENWNPVKYPWTTNAVVGTGGNANNALWYIYPSGGVASPDNSNFAMVDSDAVGPYIMESNLVSSPISLLDYNTPINLTFNHFYSTYNNPPNYYSTATVEISEDGENWTVLKTYTGSDVGGQASFAAESINLNAYSGKPYLLLRFHYTGRYDDVWAIDDIKITGSPNPTTITWSPTTDLYMDAAGNIPYSGQNTATVYASPSVSTTYTASATTAVGCPASATVTVERGDKDWTAATGNWNSAATWSPAGIPTIDHCVKIPTGKTVTVNIPDAKAKNITIKSGGKLEIAGNLTVEEKVVNENTGTGAADQFVLLSSTENSNANYLQNSNTPNTSADGVMRAERRVTDMDNVLSGTNAQMDYVYWSAPVAGQDLQAFSPGTPANRIYQYNEPTDLFVKATGNFVPAKGYAIRAETGKPDTPLPSYDKTYNFRGIANNGDIPISIQRTNSSGTTGIGYNLVGNPYPSNIDFDELYYGNSSLIYNTAWFWTNNSYEEHQQGSSYGGNNYAVYNGTGGNAPTTPSGQPAYPDGIIKVGQGFIVQKKTVGSGSLEFKNSYGTGHNLRVTNDGTFFHKGNTPKNRFWIKLIAPEGLVNTQLIGYISGATDGYEQDFDAEAMSLSSDLFYSVLDDKKLVIQGKSVNFNIEDKIPIGANIFKDGNYTIALDKAEGIFETDQNIYLKDNLLETVTNLSEQDYTFVATAGITEGRFEIIYQPETILSTAGSLKDDLLIFRDRDDFVIRSRSTKITGLEVYDGAGRLIFSSKPNQTETRIPATALGNGMYLLKVDRNGTMTAKKILK